MLELCEKDGVPLGLGDRVSEPVSVAEGLVVKEPVPVELTVHVVLGVRACDGVPLLVCVDEDVANSLGVGLALGL